MNHIHDIAKQLAILFSPRFEWISSQKINKVSRRKRDLGRIVSQFR